MKRLALLLGLPLCAFILAAATPDTPATIAADLEANPPTDLDSFYAIKKRVGDQGVLAIEAQLTVREKQVMGDKWKATGGPACLYPQWLKLYQAGLALARAATSDSDWATNRDQINRAITERSRIHDLVMAGQKVDPAYDNSSVRYAARAASYPAGSRARELAVRATEDQFQRNGEAVLQSHSLWAAGLTPAAWTYMSMYKTAEGCRVDLANIEWLKADVAAHGWPKLSVYGKDTLGDAHIMVQHADQDIAFQRQVLALMEALLAIHEVPGQNYAFLYDRVAMNSGGLTRYGAVGNCNAQGQWEPYNLEDPANLDARRASVGLGPEAEYKAKIRCFTAKG